MTNHFQGNKDHPQHVSVGAILIDAQGRVCCHHFHVKDRKGYWPESGLDEFYLLMRETVEPNEPLEHAAHRGLMEEFGATAELVDYAGAIKSRFYDSGIEIEKTTVYFLFKVIDQDTSKRTSSDAEQGSVIEWLPPEFLIPIMKKQTDKHGRTDIDESSILERYIAR